MPTPTANPHHYWSCGKFPYMSLRLPIIGGVLGITAKQLYRVYREVLLCKSALPS